MQDNNEHVEQIFRIEALKGEIEDVTTGQCIFGKSAEDIPPDIEEQFLEYVLAFENAEQVRHKDLLARDGLILPPPEELSDEELGLKLNELIYALEKRNTFLEYTNHLSDREVYTKLFYELLEEWTPDLPPGSPMNCHLPLVSDNDDEIYLKYYSDEENRQHWAKEFQDMVIPPHEEPPYDRDRHLPKAYYYNDDGVDE